MKHSIVVGGSGGIGRAVVELFARRACVSVIGRHAVPGCHASSRVRHRIAEITDPDGVDAALRSSVDELGPPSHLVFLQRYRGDADPWQGELQTSLSGTRQVIEACAGLFPARGDHSIVVVSSIAAEFVADQPLGYHVAKAGLRQMVRYYAVTLGRQRIRVNSVSPYTVLKATSRDYYLKNKRLQALYREIIPLGRMGTAEDVANVIGFLCSPAAKFVTGQDIIIDGGLSLLLQEPLMRQLSGV